LIGRGMMAAKKERPATERSQANPRPIELVTENGFCVLRMWEIDRMPPPDAGEYHFLVRQPDGLERAREVTVHVADDAVAQIEKSTQGRIVLSSTFWIYCAELHLANYLWRNDDYPPGGTLSVDKLSPQDFELAMRWETT
jgi:hypothetical protein